MVYHVSFTKSKTLPWVFFTFVKLYKWYQIAQRITNNYHILDKKKHFSILSKKCETNISQI